jgi:hypothetical protein
VIFRTCHVIQRAFVCFSVCLFDSMTYSQLYHLSSWSKYFWNSCTFVSHVERYYVWFSCWGQRSF